MTRGFQGVTMADVAACNDMTAGGLYRHWPSKEALLEAVVDYWTDLVEVGSSTGAVTLEVFVSDRLNADLPDGELLILREGSHMSEAARAKIAEQLRAEREALGAALRTQRPGLSSQAEELLGCAMSIVIRSPGVRAARGRQTDRVEGRRRAAMKIAYVDLDLYDLSEAEVEPTESSSPLSLVTRREEVLLVAGRLFGLRGFRGVTTHDIASAAGISRPTLYGLFPTKQSIILEIINRSYHCYWADLHAAVTSATDAEAALVSVVRSYVVLAMNQPHIASFIDVEGAFDDDLVARQEEYIEEVVNLLMQARTSLGRVEADVLVRTVLALVNGLVRSTVTQGRPGFIDVMMAVAVAVLQS